MWSLAGACQEYTRIGECFVLMLREVYFTIQIYLGRTPPPKFNDFPVLCTKSIKAGRQPPVHGTAVVLRILRLPN
jgi:hypothetical protein